MAAPRRGNTRVTGTEQCYTPAVVATRLVDLLVDGLGAPTDVPWLEPAAGTGRFIDAMRERGVVDIVAYDIEPKAPGIVAQDYLATEAPAAVAGGDGAVCLTNPPFGRNHALSVPFFNHAAKSCRTIAVVVPRSWRKWSVVKRLNPHFHKIYDIDLDVTYEDAHGVALTTSTMLRTIFQVWEYRDELREPVPAPPALVRSVRPSEANAALTVFGRGCGTLRVGVDRGSPKVTTQMYLAADVDVLDDLAQVDLSPFYTQVAYTEALSVVEINYALDHWRATGEQLDPDFLRTNGWEEG